MARISPYTDREVKEIKGDLLSMPNLDLAETQCLLIQTLTALEHAQGQIQHQDQLITRLVTLIEKYDGIATTTQDHLERITKDFVTFTSQVETVLGAEHGKVR